AAEIEACGQRTLLNDHVERQRQLYRVVEAERPFELEGDGSGRRSIGRGPHEGEPGLRERRAERLGEEREEDPERARRGHDPQATGRHNRAFSKKTATHEPW